MHESTYSPLTPQSPFSGGKEEVVIYKCNVVVGIFSRVVGVTCIRRVSLVVTCEPVVVVIYKLVEVVTCEPVVVVICKPGVVETCK
ncbi:hypothetical protein Hanom_Chr00s195867g01836451 [Helianthus anomalus]